MSPLVAWLSEHGSSSLERFLEWKASGMMGPLKFSSETPLRQFVAYIDPDNQFAIEDKLSQINTLEQLSNVASYGFLKKRLETHDLHIHALWFDIYTGDVYYFSRAAKRFVAVDESSVDSLSDEIRKYYSWKSTHKGKHIFEKLLPVVAREFSVFDTFYTIFKVPLSFHFNFYTILLYIIVYTYSIKYITAKSMHLLNYNAMLLKILL